MEAAKLPPGRLRVVLIGMLLALAALAWLVATKRMDGMDAGPGTDRVRVGRARGSRDRDSARREDERDEYHPAAPHHGGDGCTRPLTRVSVSCERAQSGRGCGNCDRIMASQPRAGMRRWMTSSIRAPAVIT